MNTIEHSVQPIRMGISGRIDSWEVVNKDGSIADHCYVSHKNTILDTGLDFWGTTNTPNNSNPWLPHSPFSYCAIGTGTPVNPVPTTDVALDAEVIRGQVQGNMGYPSGTWAYGAYFNTTLSAVGSSPYYIAVTIGIETPYGALNGTYGELGFAPWSTGDLFSKYRILDELGNPTTVPVTSEQQLRIKYVVTVEIIPSTSTAGVCYIKGISAEPSVEDFAYTGKWVDTTIDVASFFGTISGGTIMGVTNATYSLQDIGTSSLCYNAPFSAIAYNSATVAAYVAGTHYRTHTAIFSTTQANATLRAMCIGYNYSVGYVSIFDVPFTKYNTHRLTLSVKFSWARA